MKGKVNNTLPIFYRDKALNSCENTLLNTARAVKEFGLSVI